MKDQFKILETNYLSTYFPSKYQLLILEISQPWPSVGIKLRCWKICSICSQFCIKKWLAWSKITNSIEDKKSKSLFLSLSMQRWVNALSNCIFIFFFFFLLPFSSNQCTQAQWWCNNNISIVKIRIDLHRLFSKLDTQTEMIINVSLEVLQIISRLGCINSFVFT